MYLCQKWKVSVKQKFSKLSKQENLDVGDHCCISFICLAVNPCAAELFISIFYSFKAGIANAISSFKWQFFFYIYEK